MNNTKINQILTQVAMGEDSTHQFKVDITRTEALAAEMASFANAHGGVIYIGVSDDGSAPGLPPEDVGRINQLISNAASQGVRSPLIVETQNIALENGNILIELKIPQGFDKPYFDKNGIIWLRTGSDKRKINSKEELRRLFQTTKQFHADELPTNAEVNKIDKLRFQDLLKDVYNEEYPADESQLSQLLKNMNLLADNGKLNLAGVLMFAQRPQWIVPQFIVKSIRFYGNDLQATDYADTEDFDGPISRVFNDSLAFIMRNLHKLQAGRNVNSPGVSEVPRVVFEELLVNALIHRDYFISAPIRIFVFDNRIEIVSPGHLPNNLTVDKILTGNSNIRNPILASYVAKGLLPYHGLGSGIRRALSSWSKIDFINDTEGCTFTAVIHRPPMPTEAPANNVNDNTLNYQYKSYNSGWDEDDTKTQAENKSILANRQNSTRSEKIVQAMRVNNMITIQELASITGVSGRSIQRTLREMQAKNIIRRVGGRKYGYWEVL